MLAGCRESLYSRTTIQLEIKLLLRILKPKIPKIPGPDRTDIERERGFFLNLCVFSLCSSQRLEFRFARALFLETIKETLLYSNDRLFSSYVFSFNPVSFRSRSQSTQLALSKLRLALLPIPLLLLPGHLLPQLPLQLLPTRRRNHRIKLQPHVHGNLERGEAVREKVADGGFGFGGVGFEADDGCWFFLEAWVGDAKDAV